MAVYQINQGTLRHEFTFLPPWKVSTSYVENGLEDTDNNIGFMQWLLNIIDTKLIAVKQLRFVKYLNKIIVNTFSLYCLFLKFTYAINIFYFYYI